MIDELNNIDTDLSNLEQYNKKAKCISDMLLNEYFTDVDMTDNFKLYSYESIDTLINIIHDYIILNSKSISRLSKSYIDLRQKAKGIISEDITPTQKD